jgi:hypothetical protein
MSDQNLDLTPRWRRATDAGTLQRPVGNGCCIALSSPVQHYYAIAEPASTGGFRIRFPERPGITCAAGSARDIVPQAQDALALMLRYPSADLPHSIEDGARPPVELSDYENRLVVVIPFERVPAATVA